MKYDISDMDNDDDNHYDNSINDNDNTRHHINSNDEYVILVIVINGYYHCYHYY